VPLPGELDDARRLVFDAVGHARSINVRRREIAPARLRDAIGTRTSAVLGPAFFEMPADVVARELLGRALVRRIRGKRVALTILETEAYLGPHDLACHAARGRTTRTEVMYGPPGTLYIYFVYGLHWMLNVVTGAEGEPAAVLIRSAGGVSGPARLTRTLRIDGALNGRLAEPGSGLWFETGKGSCKAIATPRIGVDYAGPRWSARKLRFLVAVAKREAR
jgi:DNA-3-methyladenine glycosylase